MASRTTYIITLCVLTFSKLAIAQSVDLIIEKHFKAIGGIEKWKTLKSIKIVRSHSYSSDENFINTVFILPKKAMIHESVLESGQNHMIYGIYENEGWRVNAPMPVNDSFTFSKMSDDEIAFFMRQTDLLYGLEDYKNVNCKWEFIGYTTIDNVSNFEIKMISNEGRKIFYYFDTNTSLLTKMSGDVSVLSMGMAVQSDIYFTKFKTVDGYIFPFEISISSNQISFGQRRIFNVEKITINPEIDIKIFKKTK